MRNGMFKKSTFPLTTKTREVLCVAPSSSRRCSESSSAPRPELLNGVPLPYPLKIAERNPKLNRNLNGRMG